LKKRARNLLWLKKVLVERQEFSLLIEMMKAPQMELILTIKPLYLPEPLKPVWATKKLT